MVARSDSLFQRANINNNLPSRYVKKKLIGHNYDPIESIELGIKIHLPPLKTDELVQLQFVIAEGRDRLSNWFAVDAYPKEILLQAGCK